METGDDEASVMLETKAKAAMQVQWFFLGTGF